MYEIFERALKEKGVTSYAVSKETGVAQSSLSDWKHGKSVPNAKSLLKIARFLDIDLVTLIEGEKEMPNEIPTNPDGQKPGSPLVIPHLRIETSGYEAHIFVNNVEVEGVRSYSLSHSAGELPELKLDLIAADLTVDGKSVLPTLPPVFHPFFESKKFED